MAAGGLDEVVQAAAAELAATKQGARLIELGPVVLDRARSGAFTTAVVADTGALRIGDRLITGLFLARSADSSSTFSVIEAATWAANRFELEVDLDASLRAELFGPDGSTPLRLFASTSDSFLARSLHARLADLDHGGATATGTATATGMAAALVDAVQQGRAPTSDLGAIIGAPERRTDMLAAVVEQLAEAGRRLLVVSSDNTHLDRLALACHSRLGRPGPGRLVRMGVASTAEVGRERSLTALGASAALAPAAVGRLGVLDAQRRALDTTAAPPPAGPPPAVPPAPPGAGMTAATTAQADPKPTLEEARAALAEADATLEQAEAASRGAADAHSRARRAVREHEAARALHARVDEAVRDVEEALGESLASASGVGRLAAGPLADLLVAAEVATYRLDRRDAALAELAAAQAAAAPAPRRGAVATADRQLAELRSAHAAAERAALAARARRSQLAGELAELTRTGDQRVEISAVPPMRAAAPPTDSASPATPAARAEALRRLTAEHHAARAQLSEQTGAAIRGAQVVFCTWGQLLGNAVIYEAAYDEVIVEQAASVPAAWALWAAGRSKHSLVLGYQPGDVPAAPALPTTGAPAELRRWVASSLPALLGLDTAAAVAQHTGGLVLE